MHLITLKFQLSSAAMQPEEICPCQVTQADASAYKHRQRELDINFKIFKCCRVIGHLAGLSGVDMPGFIGAVAKPIYYLTGRFAFELLYIT